MKFYDIVLDSCNLTKETNLLLGFEKIAVANRDFVLCDAEKNANCEGGIAIGKDSKSLEKATKRDAKAVIALDFNLDMSLLESMREHDTVLLIPFSPIESSRGIALSHKLFLASRLLYNARKRNVKVGFITLAHSVVYLESYMQLIALAKLIGAREEEARIGISIVGNIINTTRSGKVENEA
ncbi:MAG: hypothetical protein ACP5TL_01160 [Candidatus Micrarchaeia archaeon]